MTPLSMKREVTKRGRIYAIPVSNTGSPRLHQGRLQTDTKRRFSTEMGTRLEQAHQQSAVQGDKRLKHHQSSEKHKWKLHWNTAPVLTTRSTQTDRYQGSVSTWTYWTTVHCHTVPGGCKGNIGKPVLTTLRSYTSVPHSCSQTHLFQHLWSQEAPNQSFLSVALDVSDLPQLPCSWPVSTLGHHAYELMCVCLPHWPGSLGNTRCLLHYCES